MFRQSPRKNQRSGGMKTKRVLQIGLLLGVFIWFFVHGSDKKDSSPKFSEKQQRDGNDIVIKFGRKDLKLKRETYSEDDKPMDVHPLERSHFEDETKPEEQDNNMGMIKHIENYANNLKETETEEGSIAKEKNMGTVENFADNLKETETEEGGVAKEMGTLESNEVIGDDQKMDGVEKDIIDVAHIDTFNKIDDRMFEEETSEHDAEKYDGEHIDSEGASIKMNKNMKKHGKSEADAGIGDGERGKRTSVENGGKGNEYGNTIDVNGRKEDKSEGILEANENRENQLADSVESENKIGNEIGELMEENRSKESTNVVLDEENKGNGKVSDENSQKSAGDDEAFIEQKVVQESEGIKGKGNEKRIPMDRKEVVKNDKVGKHEDVLNEKIRLPEGNIIGIQEQNPNVEVASNVTYMTSKNGTEIEKGSFYQPENTKSKKRAKKENSSHRNQNKVSDHEDQKLLGSTEKLNTNDKESNPTSIKVKVKVANSDPNGSNGVESVAAEGQSVKPKTSQITTDIYGVEVGQNVEPKTSQITADISGVEMGQNPEPKTYQDSAERSGVAHGKKKSSINEIHDLDVHFKSGSDAKGDGNEINNGSSTQSRIKNLSHVTSSSNEDETPLSHAEGTETLSNDTSSSNGDETSTSNEEEAVIDSSENNEDESSSSSVTQEEKEARTDLDTLPEVGASNNDATE